MHVFLFEQCVSMRHSTRFCMHVGVPGIGAGRGSTAEQKIPLFSGLPAALWMYIVSWLNVPDLIVAARTCRLFQEVLSERVRDAMIRCLWKAETRWGSDLMPRFGVMSSLVHFGLHPLTLNALPHPQPYEQVEILQVSRVTDGKFVLGPLDGEGPAPDGFVRLGQLPSGFSVDVVYDDMAVSEGLPLELREKRPRASIFGVSSTLGRVQEALGVKLALLQVELQGMMGLGRTRLTSKIPTPVWFEEGILLVVLVIPPESVAGFLDEQGKLPPEAETEAWRVLLGMEAISDVVCVAAALNMSCVVAVGLSRGSILTKFAMVRCAEPGIW